jgi:Protein of unknown function (DUF3224)
MVSCRMPTAKGTFTVNLATLAAHHEGGASSIGRRSIDKVFLGDLEGLSCGEMLAIMGEVKGSAGYVAMERVSGNLAGKSGTFALQHSSKMVRGAPEQSITVVPDSATGELVGLRGSMLINIEGGVHSYAFTYEIDG